MDLLANLQSLTQTQFDSGALSGLGAVVHRLTIPGEHRLVVFQGERPIHREALQVRAVPEAAMPGASTGAAPPPPFASLLNQLHVDLGVVLSNIGPSAPQPTSPPLSIGAQGYVMFSGPPNTSDLAVQIHAPGAENEPPVFDSRQLGDGDIYAVTVFRPGKYTLRNGVTGATGELQVSYPVIGTTPYEPPEPSTVQVGERGFQPSSVQLKPAQGLIFHIGHTKARIQIELVEPDDGPKRDPTPLHRWEKPAPPSGGKG